MMEFGTDCIALSTSKLNWCRSMEFFVAARVLRSKVNGEAVIGGCLVDSTLVMAQGRSK